MAAGVAMIAHLLAYRNEIYPALERTTAAIADGVAKIAAELGIALTTNRVGSMFTWFFTPSEVRDFESASASDTAAFARFHRAMMEHGVWLPPSQFEAAFVSAVMGRREVDAILAAAKEALAAVEH
jgi:glutamate-1-semialdehyde 2,1-aminomutase